MMNFEATGELEKVEKYSGDQWELESHIAEGADAGQEIQRFLMEQGWTEDEIGSFDYAVTEAITNAITHANWGLGRLPNESNEEFDARLRAKEADPAATAMKVVVIKHLLDDNKKIAVSVRSEVKTEIDPKNIPDPTNPENLLRTTGRGIDSIFKSCDEVHFAPGEITMIKYRKASDEIK
jgi:hypothetical protein